MAKYFVVLMLMWVPFQQTHAQASSSCSRPSQLDRMLNTDKFQIFVKCVNDYYDQLEKKRQTRVEQIQKLLAVSRDQLKKIYPAYNQYSGMVRCADAKPQEKECSRLVQEQNVLIDEMNTLLGWEPIRPKTEAEQKAKSEILQKTCQERGYKCPQDGRVLRTNYDMINFYLDCCI